MTKPESISNGSQDHLIVDGRRRKLRPLIITMGSERQAHMEELFSHPAMVEHFDPPVFSAGVPSRSLRSRVGFLRIAHEAGLVPDEEWRAIEASQENAEFQQHPENLFECLNDIPVLPGRRGSSLDVKLHYSVELWRKAKGVNRGRGVLACTLAHLLAMKQCVAEGFDLILEDNVRAPPTDCARRIWESIEASDAWERDQSTADQCHLRYYGWLGSIPNVKWVHETYAKTRQFGQNLNEATVFPFPMTHDIEVTAESEDEETDAEADAAGDSSTKGHRKPGGTPIWGAYAYWISQEGYDCLSNALRKDVGALLWKGKRHRCYSVKPIDKVMPRQISASLGRQCIHVTTHPSFFRAPMLTSKIHAQWDAEFCKSTSWQMRHVGLHWSDLWLTDIEHAITEHHEQTGDWISMAECAEREKRGPQHCRSY